jgi:hypothetical protein
MCKNILPFEKDYIIFVSNLFKIKNMKKIILAFIAVFTFVSFFSSCSKDDSSPSIVGKWKTAKNGVLVNNVIEWTDAIPDVCDQDYIQINGDKSYITLFNYDLGNGCESENDVGTWNEENSFLTTYSNTNPESTVKIYSLTNSVLTIEFLDQDTLEPTGEYVQLVKFDSAIPVTAEKIIGTWKFAGEMTNGVFVPDEQETCDDEILKMNSNFSARLTVKDCGFPDVPTDFTWEKLATNSYRIYNNSGLDKNITVEYSNNYNTMVIYSATDSSPDVWEKQ